ncbi:hypothetical protein VHN57_01980 [Sphingobium sp. WW5]
MLTTGSTVGTTPAALDPVRQFLVSHDIRDIMATANEPRFNPPFRIIAVTTCGGQVAPVIVSPQRQRDDVIDHPRRRDATVVSAVSAQRLLGQYAGTQAPIRARMITQMGRSTEALGGLLSAEYRRLVGHHVFNAMWLDGPNR